MAKAKVRGAKTADAFVAAVEQALEKWGDAQWLGEHSPLAAPYFIGQQLAPATDTHATGETRLRGQALRDALAGATHALEEQHARVLNASFFQRKRSLNNTGVARQLGQSEATYYRHRAAAIEALANAFNKAIVPPLRSELPRARHIVGRGAVVQACVEALSHRQSVALTGRSGIGKTSVGAAVAGAWGLERTFWFTVRPGLNDNLSSVAFSFSHFLRGLGLSNAWRQLAADHDAVNAERILGLLHFDLKELFGTPVLICVDDSDQLRPELRAHAQAVQFIEALSKLTPALLLSQQPLYDADQQIVLNGLSVAESADLLTAEGVAATDVDHAGLQAITRGHPLLIKLFCALVRTGESAEAVLRQLDGERSAEALFARLWRRLTDAERATAMALAVFRTPSPQDAWQAQQNNLDRLFALNLAQTDGAGGVTLVTHARELVQARIPPDAHTALHLRAAHVRESRGEFTEAAYHYVEGDQPAMAVWLWHRHRAEETDKGLAPAARALFKRIRQGDLPDARDRRVLALLRAEQAVLTGAGEEAEAEINSVAWPAGDALTPSARELMGDTLQLQGRIEQALDQYREGLRGLDDAAQRQVVRLHNKTGYVYVSRLRNLGRAREEASMTLSQAHNFSGLVEEEEGNYHTALEQYRAALQAADAMQDGRSARIITQSHLGHLFMRMGDAPQAIQNLEAVIAYMRQIDAPVNTLYNALNLSSAYIVAGRHEDARALALESLEMAEAMRHAFLVAGLAAGAAEACLGLGTLEEAEQLAMRSLREEEEVHRPYALTTLGVVALRRGTHDHAERFLREAIGSAQSSQDRYAEAHATLALANAYQAQGRADDERAALERALTLCTQLELSRETEATQRRLEEMN